MRIGVFSDLHLGNRQYGLQEREQDFYDQYNLAIQTFLKAKVDVVICAGDVFDKSRPSPKALKVFANGIKELAKNNIPLVNIVGNHSMVLSDTFVTADDFLLSMGFDNYSLLDENNKFEKDDVKIFGLPFYHNFDLEDFCETVSRLNETANNNDLNILVVHQAFKEFCGFDGEELSIDDVDVSNFDLVICGHIHERKLLDMDDFVFLQPGSLERSNLTEAKDEDLQGKGVFIFESESFTIESVAEGFIPLKSPRRFYVSDMYMKESSDLEDVKSEILETCDLDTVPPILFLTVHDVSNSFGKIMDMVKELRSRFLTVHFNYIDENPLYDDRIIDINAEIPSPREALKIALNPMDEDDRKLGLDLYDSLKDGKDVSSILKKYEDKKFCKEQLSQVYSDEELDDLMSFFEKL